MVGYACHLIDCAEQTIEFSPCLFGGEVFLDVMDHISKRLETCRALKVSLIIVPTLMQQEQWDRLDGMQRTYPQQLNFTLATSTVDLDKELVLITNHVKILIVDETYFIQGGSNFNSSNYATGTEVIPKRSYDHPFLDKLPRGARDQDMVGKGPMAKNLREAFYGLQAVWSHYNKIKKFESKDPEYFSTAYRPLLSSKVAYCPYVDLCPKAIEVAADKTHFILSGAMHSPNKITQAYVKLIQEAKEEIVIGNLYFAPVDPIYNALLDAVKRGVKLTIITNGIYPDSPEFNTFFAWASRGCYLPMMMGKKYGFFDKSESKKDLAWHTRIYEYHVEGILYHKKVMVVDKQKVLVGSYNLGIRSDVADYETIMIVENPHLAQQMEDILLQDISLSEQISLKEARDWYFDLSICYVAELQKRFHGLM
jgi:phosphatidylserine/phosphatidylglycerophosphate/cardiolipin synthase-like enzyme